MGPVAPTASVRGAQTLSGKFALRVLVLATASVDILVCA